MNKKYSYLLKNIGILTISNFGSKILSFILIPLYTSILSTEQYGLFDLYTTTILLLIPILTLDIVQSVMRFSLDQTCDRQAVFKVGMNRIVKSSIIIIIIVFINYIFNLIPIFNSFPIFFIALFILECFYSLFSQFARGCENIRAVAIAGLINSIIMLLTNILFLMVFKMGIDGYFFAYILSYLFSIIYLIFKLKILNIVDKCRVDKNLKNKMERYSKPLIISDISWWFNNVSDRYTVTWLCGVASNGIYSVAYKIPSILNVFQSIFNQAWTISAVKEFDSKNISFFSNIYKVYNCGMVIICSLLIVINKLIAKILFSNEFFLAWQYSPFLMISVVFGALSGLLGGIFSASKNSSSLAKTTFVGALINISLNIFLVYFMGPIGAAISTLISYFVVWLLRYISVKKILNINIKLTKDICAYIILLIQSSIYFIDVNYIILYLLEILFICIIIVIYARELKFIFNKFLNNIGRKSI